LDTERLERVLIIKPSSLGDIIHALPVASSIKSAFPGVKIDWVVGKAYTELLEGNPDIERVIEFDRGMLKGPGRIGRLVSFARELRRERYDIVIDLQGLLRSALMAFACRAGVRAGFENAREGAPLFYSVRVKVPDRDMHAVDRYMLLPAMLGIRDTDTTFNLATGQQHLEQARKLLSEAGITEGTPFVAVAPSARWVTKRWDPASFADVSRELYSRFKVRSVYVGTAEDRSVMQGVDGWVPAGSAEIFGRTGIKTLSAVFKLANAVLTNDSGPMHIAAAAGTPTVALFGPTDPKRTGPYGEGHRVLTSDVECAPCFSRGCSDVRCLSGINPGDVLKALTEVLKLEGGNYGDRQGPA
jgi:lipopolysaccharide heptosyltransferase I